MLIISKIERKILDAISDEEALRAYLKCNVIELEYENISELELHFYEIDIEVLFSRTPFVLMDQNDDFDFIKPNLTVNLTSELKDQKNKMSYAMPKEYQTKNIFININST